MSTGLFYGQIVRIRVARHGKEKLRPVVVVTPNEAMAEGTRSSGWRSPGHPIHLRDSRCRCPGRPKAARGRAWTSQMPPSVAGSSHSPPPT
jgi:hypothetical protein